MSSVNHDEFAHLKIPLEDVISATNHFNDKNVLQKNVFGNNCGGQLLWSGELTDIHALRYNKECDDKIEKQFWIEISLLSGLKHKNVVSLVGFCDEKDEKIIIMRREIRGSLSNYLSDPMLLTWVQRLKISVGVAHALSYIHYDEPRDFSIIHRNISSATVYLNDDWEPKLSQFDRSMKIKASERHHSFNNDACPYGPGYVDSTFLKAYTVNHKSDIYSFGIVLFELLCGRESIIDSDSNKYLALLAVTHYREKKLNEIIDWDLWKQMDSQSFDIFAEIAHDCLSEERSQRPNIDEIVTRLEKALELQLEHQNEVMSLLKDDFAHLKIPLDIIQTATKNFADENLYRDYTFAKDYMGNLLWSDDLIRIIARRYNKEKGDKKEQQFWMEISMLSRFKHKNVVSLVGFCDENDEKIIIYTLETRGSLSNYLSDPMLLTWVRRLEICVGLAQALSYIHYDESRDFSIIHRQINSNIVLLNDDWEPKLSQFDRSLKIKASQRHQSFSNAAHPYDPGYVDSTFFEGYTVNHKSDIYSFGIVLFELLFGRKAVIADDQDNQYLAPLAITHYRERRLDEIIDSDLWKQIDSQSFDIFVETTYDCLNEERSQRPNIDEIVTRLERALELQLKREDHDNSIVEGTSSFMHKKFQHLKIELQAIKSATNKFADSHCIGRGGFGKVYKGELVHSKGQSVVALKRLDIWCIWTRGS